MKEYNRVCAKVNLNCIEENFLNMAQQVGSQSRLMCVIKTDGYGHGAVPIAKHLQKQEALYGYAVATAEEAVELRGAGIDLPVLILGYTFPDCYEQLAALDIIPAVFREDSLQALSAAARKTGKLIKVHVKVDTGMSRIGVTPDAQGLSFVEKVLHTEGLVLDGIFTHFARADEADKSCALKQFQTFSDFIKKIEQQYNITIPHKHCANSAGIMELPQSYLELVRAGISLYGLWPSDEMRRDGIVLKPALSLYSHIVYIKEISAGTAVSYGGTFVAAESMRIATIPVGYGDGYPRALSGKGYVLIRGQKAPILGRVCMDQMMVDVTHIKNAEMDDLVTLIGTDGEETISMEALGDLSGRFNYELACDLGKRIPRIYTYNGEQTAVRDFYTE